MSTPFSECAETVRQLHVAVVELACAGKLLQLPPLAGREWFELLRQKLLPQLDDDAFLVVAVVGGTNIGKSVIFNHIAGSRASSTSPLASGTSHPVCLVPPGFDKPEAPVRESLDVPSAICFTSSKNCPAALARKHSARDFLPQT